MKINWLKDIDVFEVSYVNRPAIDKRFIALKIDDKSKNVVPFKSSKFLDENETFNEQEIQEKAEVKDLAKISAYYNAKDAKNKSAYQLLHHSLEKGYPVNIKAVEKGIDFLNTTEANGFTEEEREDIYNHLKSHLDDCGIKAIELKSVEEINKPFIEKLKDKLGFRDEKIGRVLSKANEAKLNNIAKDLANASKTITSVLSSVKQKGNDMNEEEIKNLISQQIDEKMSSLEEKLDKLTKEDYNEGDKDAEDTEEPEEVENIVDEAKDKKEDKVEEKKEEIDVDAKIKEGIEKGLKSVEDKIRKELHIKPNTDKKKITSVKETEDGEVDFTGTLGLKNL